MKWSRFAVLLPCLKLTTNYAFALWFIALILFCRHVNHNGLKTEDIYISVKTTSKNFKTRLQPIHDTWYQLAPDHIHFTTDTIDDSATTMKFKHMHVTDCKASHSLLDLLCKLQAEFDSFLASLSVSNRDKKWFCHFDDGKYFLFLISIDHSNLISGQTIMSMFLVW